MNQLLIGIEIQIPMNHYLYLQSLLCRCYYYSHLLSIGDETISHLRHYSLRPNPLPLAWVYSHFSDSRLTFSFLRLATKLPLYQHLGFNHMLSLHLLWFLTIIKVSESILYCGSRALGFTGFQVGYHMQISLHTQIALWCIS